MVDSIFSGLSLSDIHGDLLRNIVSIRVSQDLFDDLSDSLVDRQSAIKLELECKPQVFSSLNPVIHRPFEEAAWNEAIEYPFRNWMQSRYSDGTFGVWYGADSIETTIFETVHHWRSGLLEDAEFVGHGIRMERKVYGVRCDAALVDMRGALTRYPALIDPGDYTFTQQVGGRLHREGYPGLVSRSARCDGEVYAVLNPAVLSGPRQHCWLTYTTTADGVEVERSPGKRVLVVR